MLPAIDTATGQLPLGRFPATLEILEQRYVGGSEYSASTTRRDIWDDFMDVTTGLRGIVPVCYAWVSGSFMSSKLDPEDIDVLYWCEDSDINAAATTADTALMELLQAVAQSNLRAVTGHKVDSRIGQWHVRPEPGLQSTQAHWGYASSRGFWDDFWMRNRSGPKDAPPVRADALPRRGYVEVELDGHRA